jgi:hypothetical protein
MKDKMKKLSIWSHRYIKRNVVYPGDLTIYLTYSMPPSLAIRLFKSQYKDLFKR